MSRKTLAYFTSYQEPGGSQGPDKQKPVPTPSERPTERDLEDSPTLRAWEVETIAELETQLVRLRTGRACKRCRGSGEVTRTGGYVAACGDCNGRGLA